MSDGLEVQARNLYRAAGGFETAATSVGRIFDRLKSRLNAEGNCWGDDETGKAFAENYITKAKANEFKDGGPDIVGGLKKVQKNIETMAKRYEDAEDRSRIR